MHYTNKKFGHVKILDYFCAVNYTVMQNSQENIAQLRNSVELVVGRKIEHPKDFDFLEKQIEGYVGEHISVSTLKRVWGYVSSNSEISIYTLNVMSRMVGYTGWEEFCQSQNGAEEESSHKIICRKLFTSALSPGTMISLAWRPDRKIIVRFEGQDLFLVQESVNSKLAVGDIFHCAQFVEKQPLFLSGLYRQGMPPCDYICGRQGGIVWSIIDQKVAQ